MGDVDSLALGAAMASMAIVLEKRIYFAIIAFVFVFGNSHCYYSTNFMAYVKKRVFRYTPIHYSFTLNGWKEKML